jgi:hypothetical protein
MGIGIRCAKQFFRPANAAPLLKRSVFANFRRVLSVAGGGEPVIDGRRLRAIAPTSVTGPTAKTGRCFI